MSSIRFRPGRAAPEPSDRSETFVDPIITSTGPAARPASSDAILNILPVSALTPADHASLILPAGSKGITVLGRRQSRVNEKGETEWGWIQRGANASEIRQVVAGFQPDFVSMSAFSTRTIDRSGDYHTHPDKRLVNLNSFGAVWVDLDQYNKPAWKHATDAGMVWEILDRLYRAGRGRGVPAPSYIVRSGTGYHVVWLTERVPPKAHKAWKALQAILNDLFVDMGRDKAVMPATANLRLVGTRNAGRPVEMIWPTAVGEIHRHSFRDLCRAAFPYTPEQVKDYHAERAKAAAVRKAAAKTRVMSGASPRLTGQSYMHTLRTDLEKLLAGRHPVAVEKGERNMWLVALAKVWAWTMPGHALRAHVVAQAARLGFSPAMALSHAGSVIRRAEAQDRSEKPLGKRGRYPVGPKNLVAEFGVTVVEAQRLDLRMMIPASLKRPRAAERAAKSRLASGATPRAKVQAERLSVGQKALAMRECDGLTRAQICAALSVKPAYLDKAMAEAKAVKAIAAKPELRKSTKVDPEASCGSSRYIACEDEALPMLAACGQATYNSAVHEEAALLPDPRPVTPETDGGPSHVRAQPASRQLPIPPFLRKVIPVLE